MEWEDGAQAKLKRVRRRIERWRWTRTKGSPMPAVLWTAAVELARGLGAHQVARELGIGYQSLKNRLGDEVVNGKQRADAFVEIDGAALFTASGAGTRGEVELSDASGVKVVIRLGAGESVDIGALLTAFRRVQA
jgi:hypothetical protein